MNPRAPTAADSTPPGCAYHPPGVDLLCAILEQAVHDYKGLAAAGFVEQGRLTPKADTLVGKKMALGMTRLEIEELVRFLQSESFDRLCREGLRVALDPQAVRERLGFFGS